MMLCGAPFAMIQAWRRYETLTFGCNIDFSNRIKKTAIERLAEMDEHEVVREVQVIEPSLFFLSHILLIA